MTVSTWIWFTRNFGVAFVSIFAYTDLATVARLDTVRVISTLFTRIRDLGTFHFTVAFEPVFAAAPLFVVRISPIHAFGVFDAIIARIYFSALFAVAFVAVVADAG